MNIDRTARYLLAEIIRKDLHVAGEDDEVSPGLIHNLHQRCFLLSFGLLGHRQVDKTNAFALGHRT
ncbi:hypothetical protein D3C80_1370100 [compost metagenome]